MILANDWEKILCSNVSTDERRTILRNMFRGYDVVIDGPNLFFWKELLEVFPKCRVIHHYGVFFLFFGVIFWRDFWEI